MYITSAAMMSGDAGDSRPRGDRSGVSFHCELHTSWNAPESYVNLESSGLVELDTSVVPDVLGLRALYEDAKPTRVLPGRAQNSVRVLIPDARAKPCGFHDMMLVDMPDVSGPAVSTADMSHLRQQWHTSLVKGMTRWQTDLKLLRRECKRRFRNMQAGICAYCGRHIVHGMARHVPTHHLDLAEYSAQPAPVVCPFPSDRRRPTLPVSLPQPRFGTQDFALQPDTAQSHSVTTLLYPSSTVSWSSTPCYDLAEFDSENSRTDTQTDPLLSAAEIHNKHAKLE